MNGISLQTARSGPKRRLVASMMVAALTLGAPPASIAQDKPAASPSGVTTLITATPEEGFALAIKLSQKGVATTQKDVAVRKALRPAYAHDPDSLIAVSHVIATHFQTIAAANNYWRK
ncbi:MAG TPA: hexameric tyrosine-coordinated heme protein [Thiobacillaceae bacterium]|nr:hexameric tyrosine-coordinated heme protein [Thiobacillaceae bacterium]